MNYRAWIKRQPCPRCGVESCDPHHVKARGMGGGRDESFDEGNLIPLCRVCHTDLHKVGRSRFESWMGHTLEQLAGIYWHLYQARNGN